MEEKFQNWTRQVEKELYMVKSLVIFVHLRWITKNKHFDKNKKRLKIDTGSAIIVTGNSDF